jgi:hypothetical protein
MNVQLVVEFTTLLKHVPSPPYQSTCAYVPSFSLSLRFIFFFHFFLLFTYMQQKVLDLFPLLLCMFQDSLTKIKNKNWNKRN